MKIIVIGPDFPDSFARNVCLTLTAMGHEAVNIAGSYAKHNASKLVRGLWTVVSKGIPVFERLSLSGMIREVGRAHPDVILVTIGSLSPETVAELRLQSNGPVVCWYTDPMANWHRQFLLASPWHAMFLKEPRAVRLLNEQLGQKAYYLPEAMNPMWHRPVTPTPKDLQEYGCDLLAQGTLHYYRARMLEPFADYDLKIWGSNNPSWIRSASKQRYMNAYVAETLKARVFASSKIAINIVNHLEIEGVNCSLFEYAGCGLFQIVESKPTLKQLFEPEDEIVTYSDRLDLKEKVDFYLSRPELRQRIAAKASARAHREHTYENRLNTMLMTLSSRT
jgi:spore maturation protein CgeB